MSKLPDGRGSDDAEQHSGTPGQAGDACLVGGGDFRSNGSSGPAATEARIVGLISSGHFFSHFYYLILPSLFPLLAGSLDVSYTALGLAMGCYGLASLLGQMPVSFFVDRVGAPPVLCVGVAVSGLAFVLMGLFPTYYFLAAMMFVYGLGDSVSHPANYSILSRTISPHRIGRAYAIHNFSGQLGFATAPLVTSFVASWLGWEQVLLAFGLAGIGVASLVFVSQGMLSGQPVSAEPRPRPKAAAGGGLAVLLSRPLLLSLVMFIGLSLVNSAVRDFGAAVLSANAGFTAVQTGMVISCFLGAMLVGVLVGGWVVDATRRPGAIAVCVLGLIAAILAIVSLAGFGLTMLAILFAALGLSVGILGPTRDLLVRSLVPVEHIGKAFGFVSLGISIASLIAPLLYGFLLDRMEPLFVFRTAAGFAVATMVVVLVQSARPR